jgi:hypothetical protein
MLKTKKWRKVQGTRLTAGWFVFLALRRAP